MSKQINTVIVLRNDSSTAWADSEIVMLKGEVGISYLENGNVIAKLGDGVNTWADLSQIEGVLEKDLTLTYDFGRFKTKNGYVNAGGEGMTVQEWLKDALSEIKEPAITQPNFTMGASIVGGGEIGSYITGVKWNGGFSVGSYQYGSQSNPDSTATGLAASDVTWAVTNTADAQTGSTEDGTFSFTSGNQPQVDSESNKTYVTINASYSMADTNARVPLNNVGQPTEGKITAKTGSVAANANATGYRKPFWGIQAAADAPKVATEYTSTDVRALSNSGTSTAGLPTSLTVPTGSQQVCFFAKAGARNKLTATDSNAMNASVAFTKVAKAVAVEGANGFTAADYDLWYVNWGAGIDSAKALKLAWS